MRTLMVSIVLWSWLGAARADSERAALAKEGYELAVVAASAGSERVETVYEWSLRWLDAVRDTGEAEALSAHLERMKTLETKAKALVQAGMASRLTGLAASYFRSEAEEWASGKPPAKTKPKAKPKRKP
jgi:hypothetical protein